MDKIYKHNILGIAERLDEKYNYIITSDGKFKGCIVPDFILENSNDRKEEIPLVNSLWLELSEEVRKYGVDNVCMNKIGEIIEKHMPKITEEDLRDSTIWLCKDGGASEPFVRIEQLRQRIIDKGLYKE